MNKNLPYIACCIVISLSACAGSTSLNSGRDATVAPSTAALSTDTGYRTLVGASMESIYPTRGFYVRVMHEQDGWVLDSVSRDKPARSGYQEIFYVSENKRIWHLAIPTEVAWCNSDANKDAAPYSVCNSQFGSFSKLGAMVSVATSLGASMINTRPYSVNKSDVESVVHSISEGELNEAYLKMFQKEAEQKDLERRQAEEKQRILQAKLDEQYQEEEKERLIVNQRIENNARDMRKHVRIGTQTNCGQVFDVRLPMVGVQTMVGSQYIDISKLYGPDANCNFKNGVYAGR